MAKRSTKTGEVKRDEFLDAVGHRIKVARVQAGFSPKELAALVSTTQSWIYLAEDGQQNFQISGLRKIAEVLGISVRSLMPEGPESGADFDLSKETRETFQLLIGQLTDAIGQLHRLNALTDRRKGSGLGEPPTEPKKTL